MKSTDKLKKVRALLGLEVKLEERMLENGTRFERGKNCCSSWRIPFR